MDIDGSEVGFSINALYRKYHAQLVGRMNAEIFGKDFPVRSVFTKTDLCPVIDYKKGKSCVLRTDVPTHFQWSVLMV